MDYSFASLRQLSFVVSAGGRNLLVSFGNRNQAGVAAFMTKDEKVARAIRRHALTRRGVIQETTKQQPVGTAPEKPLASEKREVPVIHSPQVTKPTTKQNTDTQEKKESEVREFDNYTVAREAICKEFGINKSTVRNPTALAKVAQEHGIIIKYKEL